jgi:hypothetical protein
MTAEMTEKEPTRQVSKICPLGSAHPNGAGPCFRELCAWWDSEKKDCALNLMTQALKDVAGILADISEVMPKSAQFPKEE